MLKAHLKISQIGFNIIKATIQFLKKVDRRLIKIILPELLYSIVYVEKSISKIFLAFILKTMNHFIYHASYIPSTSNQS